jgi:hypothetical protein
VPEESGNLGAASGDPIPAGIVGGMSDRSRKLVKPAAAVTIIATMASVWWFALRPRRKIKLDK